MLPARRARACDVLQPSSLCRQKLRNMDTKPSTPSGGNPVLNTLYDLFFRVICFANELWDILEKERQEESEKKKQAEARKEKLVDEFLAKRRFHDRINDQISRMKRESQFVPTAAIQRNTPLFRTDFLHLNSFFIFK